MQTRKGSIVFGILFGLVVAAWSYQWVTNPDGRAARQSEVEAVMASRGLLAEKLGLESLEFVDPVEPQRSVGKVYIYPIESGWEVSGYYRRDSDDDWHAFLTSISESHTLMSLKVQDGDSGLVEASLADPAFEVVPD